MTEMTRSRFVKVEDETMIVGTDRDLRGYTVRDRSGKAFGAVEGLYADRSTGRLQLLVVNVDRDVVELDQLLLVPIGAVAEIEDHSVRVDDMLEHIVRAPAYDETSLDDDRYWHELYDFYGFTPYWAPGAGAG